MGKCFATGITNCYTDNARQSGKAACIYYLETTDVHTFTQPVVCGI